MAVDLNYSGVYVLFNSNPVTLDVSSPLGEKQNIETYEYYLGMSETNLKRRMKSHSFTFSHFWAINELPEKCRELEREIQKSIAIVYDAEDICAYITGRWEGELYSLLAEGIWENNPTWTDDECKKAAKVDAIHWWTPRKKLDYKFGNITFSRFADLKPTQYDLLMGQSEYWQDQNGDDKEWKWGMDPLRGFSKFYAQNAMAVLNAFALPHIYRKNNKWNSKERLYG